MLKATSFVIVNARLLGAYGSGYDEYWWLLPTAWSGACGRVIMHRITYGLPPRPSNYTI